MSQSKVKELELRHVVRFRLLANYWPSFLIMSASIVREGNGSRLQYSCLGNPMDGGAWWATVHGVAKSWTLLSDFTFFLRDGYIEKQKVIIVDETVLYHTAPFWN